MKRERNSWKMLSTTSRMRQNRVTYSRIVGCMLGIEIKSDRVGNLDRHVPDFHFDAEPCQRRHELLVEIGHGTRRQWNGPVPAFTGPDDEVVLEKIEFHFEDAVRYGMAEVVSPRALM